MSDNTFSAFVNPADRLKYPYKIFVKPQDSKNHANSTESIATTSTCHTLTGDETKDIYESIIRDSNLDEKYAVHGSDRKKSSPTAFSSTITNKQSQQCSLRNPTTNMLH